MHSAPWDAALALYYDIDEILSYNNSLIESICQEHIKPLLFRQMISMDVEWGALLFRRRDRIFKKFKRTEPATDKLNFNIARREANATKRNAI